MSANSSSSSNASLPPPSLSFSMNLRCLTSSVGTISITSSTITSILVLLPLYIFVLYLGHQRWRQQRCSTTISHSDLFTYHMVVIELISVLGSIVLFCAVHTDLPLMMMVGDSLFIINVNGQNAFHVLTCVERYLAVVHPITYLSLRKAKWIRIRNITIGCVWLLCFASTGLISVVDQISFHIICICVTPIVFLILSFCCVSVLCVLIRPGPGKEVGAGQRVDQSKLRAFYTIMAILGVLLVRFGGGVLTSALVVSPQVGETERCGTLVSVFWFCLPSSLVLPLLFLQRTGKLLCCKNNKQSGTDQIRMEKNY